MHSPVRMMYLRPGNLYKDFVVERKMEKVSTDGRPMEVYEKVEGLVQGIIAEATQYQGDKYKHLWNQEQHSLTHTIISRGCAFAKKGDKLVHNDRVFEVLTVDNPGELGITTIYYVQERNDIR